MSKRKGQLDYTSDQCDRVFHSLEPARKRAVISQLEPIEVVLGQHYDPLVFKDIFPVLIEHLDIESYRRLKQCCQVFNRILQQHPYPALQRIRDFYYTDPMDPKKQWTMQLYEDMESLFWVFLKQAISILKLKFTWGHVKTMNEAKILVRRIKRTPHNPRSKSVAKFKTVISFTMCSILYPSGIILPKRYLTRTYGTIYAPEHFEGVFDLHGQKVEVRREQNWTEETKAITERVIKAYKAVIK